MRIGDTGYKFSIHLIGLYRKSSGELINVATLVSPTGPDSNPQLRYQSDRLTGSHTFLY
jgi:hypothetical protein